LNLIKKLALFGAILALLAACGSEDPAQVDFDVDEQCTEDMCGTCDNDPTNDCVQDCAGAWGGDAVEDECGTCDADPTNDCVQDCAGAWGGMAYEDECGTCDDNADNDCVQDCAGEWGGDAVEDNCGTCDNDPTNDCPLDCAGVPDGDAVEDMCGTCDNDPTNDCVQDCAGTWGGDAVEDMCGTCDSDPANDCIEDCNGVWGGDAVQDNCGTCDSDPTNDCVQDCSGTWGGDAVADNCGTCDNDPANDCTADCAGAFGGTATVDNCGVCVGGTTGRVSTCQTATATLEADAYVSSSSATTNYGNSDTLQVRRNGAQHTYLRFDLSSVPPNSVILGARLSMVAKSGYAWGGDGNVYAYYVPNDSWTETGINWSNRPAEDPTRLGFWWLWYDFSVSDQTGVNESAALTDRIRTEFFGDRKVSIMLASPGYDTNYYSKESADASKHPQLELYYMPLQSTTVYTEADTYARSSASTTAHGTETSMVVDRSSTAVFVRFDLASVPAGATIHRTELVATAHTGFAHGGDGNVYTYPVADDTWDESTLTWSTMPAVDKSAHLGFWWLWYDFNDNRIQVGRNSSPALTQYVASEFSSDGKVSLSLQSSGYRTNYRTREWNDASQRPYLRVDYTLP
jgi:hypothetical protein